MREFLRDELDQFLVELSLECHDGLHLNAEQVVQFSNRIGEWRDLAREQENEISRLMSNLNVRTNAFTNVCANLDRAEALLRNSDPLYQISNDILDEIDRPGSNVCLMVRPSISGSSSGGDAA